MALKQGRNQNTRYTGMTATNDLLEEKIRDLLRWLFLIRFQYSFARIALQFIGLYCATFSRRAGQSLFLSFFAPVLHVKHTAMNIEAPFFLLVRPEQMPRVERPSK
jgi:hypothetical protein